MRQRSSSRWSRNGISPLGFSCLPMPTTSKLGAARARWRTVVAIRSFLGLGRQGKLDLVQGLELPLLPSVELVHEVLKFPDVLKVPVDGGITDVGHAVQRAQPFHDFFADAGARNLEPGVARDLLFDGVGDPLDLGGGNRPLGARG